MKFKNAFSIFLICTLVLAASLVGSAQEEKTFFAQFTAEEIFGYEAYPSYQEAPSLAELVKAGKLPPVEERLPKKPRVVRTNIMADGIGQYGGVWRDTYAVPNEGWNWGAGQTQGWFGINQMIQESLIIVGPMWLMEDPEPLPNLATDWEWSEDGKTLTMHLIEGAKWSDGHPFTADDVVFTYEDYILDPNIPSWSSASAWTYEGELTKLEKVDDYTIKWHFPVAYPVHAFYNMGYLDFSVVPKHVYQPFHPKYNPESDYSDLINATPPHDVPPVVLGPWVPVRYEAGQQLIMVRNPYYWQVDEEGNQLPYLDEVWFTESTTGDTRTMNMISGTGDRTNLENPQTFTTVRQASLQPDADFNIRFGPFGIGYNLQMNLSKNLGVENDRDLAMRELFRDVNFRKAVSHAIDREAVAEIAFPGPLTRAWYGGYPTGSAYYDEDYVVKYPYDEAKAKALLADLGFADTDDDGILNWPADSAWAGEELIIELIVGEDAVASVEAAEALQPMLRRVGIDLRVRVMAGTVVSDRIDSGNFQFHISRLDSATPFVHMPSFGPIRLDSPGWHQAGPDGERFLLPFEEEIKKLMEEARVQPDVERRGEIFREILKLSTENVYTVGIYEVRRGLGLNKRIRNVQPDIPPYLYNWTINSIPIQIVWVPQELQFDTRFQDLIPTSDAYTGRSWNK